MPSRRFAANGAWLAVQVIAHNLARWTARIGLGERSVTTRTLRRRVFALVGRIPARRAVSPCIFRPVGHGRAMCVAPWPGCEPFHSRPDGQPATDPPTGQPKVPANSRHPGPRESPAAYYLAITRIAAPAEGHRAPVRRLRTVRRPPIYPNGAQAISPVAPSPPFRCPHAVHRCPSVDSG